MNKTMLPLAALAVAAMLSTAAQADNGPAPTLNITSPSGTIFLASFPATVTIQYSVAMNGSGELKNLQNLNVLVNNASLYGAANGVNAFSNANNSLNDCTGVAAMSPNTCNRTDAYNATLTVPWVITGPGNYAVVISGKYQGDVGIDSETITVATVAAEYPAPPAVANAFINSGGAWPMTGKQRGCVISKIADQHAHYSAYGPKGGPYDEAAIRAAVLSFISACPR